MRCLYRLTFTVVWPSGRSMRSTGRGRALVFEAVELTITFNSLILCFTARAKNCWLKTPKQVSPTAMHVLRGHLTVCIPCSTASCLTDWLILNGRFTTELFLQGNDVHKCCFGKPEDHYSFLSKNMKEHQEFFDWWEQVNKKARFLSSDVLVLLQPFCPEFLTIWNFAFVFSPETIRCQGSQHTPREAHLHKQFQRLALESAASRKESGCCPLQVSFGRALACALDFPHLYTGFALGLEMK